MAWIRKMQQNKKAWEELERIHYELWTLPGSISERVSGLIIKVLYKLPKRIRDRVLENVFFISIGGEGRYENFSATVTIEHLIILNIPLRYSDKTTESIIAHEIAHYYLGHTTSGGYAKEKAADRLVQKWGFQRSYTKRELLKLKAKQRRP